MDKNGYVFFMLLNRNQTVVETSSCNTCNPLGQQRHVSGVRVPGSALEKFSMASEKNCVRSCIF